MNIKALTPFSKLLSIIFIASILLGFSLTNNYIALAALTAQVIGVALAFVYMLHRDKQSNKSLDQATDKSLDN